MNRTRKRDRLVVHFARDDVVRTDIDGCARWLSEVTGRNDVLRQDNLSVDKRPDVTRDADEAEPRLTREILIDVTTEFAGTGSPEPLRGSHWNVAVPGATAPVVAV